MARQGNFTAKTKRERLKHAQGKCEAAGHVYGLPVGHTCGADLGFGVEFDHDIPLGIGGDNSFSNARAICMQCHKHKTRKHDMPRIAKTKRQADKNSGIRRPKGKLKSAPFPKPEKERKPGKEKLPVRILYKAP
jgi:5-methylcytosine-specific restriction endonuclease McrA